MGMMEHALHLAEKGFFVFPLVEGSKVPAIDSWEKKASRDPEQIKRWWTCPVMDVEQSYNIGIHTGKFGEAERPLCVIDVDHKNGKDGYATLLRHEIEGHEIPPTLENVTPTGGSHIIYLAPSPVKNGVSTLGEGLDIRGHNGYIVGPWSTVGAGEYQLKNGFDNPTMAPAWVIDACSAVDATKAALEAKASVTLSGIDAERARERGIHYLMMDCGTTYEGNRNHEGYKVAAHLKDLGCDAHLTLELMLDYWDCQPMLELDEVKHVISSAFNYSKNPRGAKAPEAIFSAHDLPEIESPPPSDDTDTTALSLPGRPEDGTPIERLNREYSLVIAGGGHNIMREYRDTSGQLKHQYLKEDTFHKYYAAFTMAVGDRQMPVTKMWMGSPTRRTYNGITFAPQIDTPGMYNQWKGFACKPCKSPKGDKFVKEYFQTHIRDVACGGDQTLAHWLTCVYAHAAQKPWEKLEVAVVFQGGKGVGKNKLAEAMVGIFGEHAFLASNERYIVSNFNAHLEAKLWVILDEASWAGDKAHGGVLKDLVTGRTLNVERKGFEAYSSPNLSRLIFLSNDDWVVPASQDERRYACLKFTEARQRDYAFFSEWDKLYEDGGREGLLDFLLSYDISEFNHRMAPTTAALYSQKTESLDPVHAWWLDSLSDGRLSGLDGFDGWPATIEVDRVRRAYQRYMKDHNFRGRAVTDIKLGKILHVCAPSLKRHRVRVEGQRVYMYDVPPLETARNEWAKWIGHTPDWDDHD